MGSPTPKVFLVEDDPAQLARIEDLLRAMDLDCRSFSTAADALASVDPGRTDCVIADLGLKGMNGLELQDHLASLDVRIPLILMGQTHDLSRAVSAMQNGAITVLEKPCDADQLATAIREALARGAQAREALQEREALHSRFDSLSPREHEVTTLIIQGLPNKTIARRLGVCQRTVARIRAAIYEKMQVASAIELALATRDLADLQLDGRKPRALSLAEPKTLGRCTRCERFSDKSHGFDERQLQLIAYDLHDGPAQYLAAGLAHLRAHQQSLADDPQKAGQSWNRGMDLLNCCMTELRRLMRGLQPAQLERYSLVSALEELLQTYRTEHGLEVEFCHDVQSPHLTPSVENTLFRIVQESLGNLWRHSHSKRCRVMLVQRDETICVEIRDWGIGGAALRVDQGHLGLAGIQQRARLFGGRATIQSERGAGTRIAVELPLHALRSN